MFNRHTKRPYWLLMLFTCFSLILAGCGSDNDNNTDNTATLSGTAATGAAIVGRVEVTGTDGAPLVNVIINNDGSFSADVRNMTPPFILAAIPDDGGQIEYSYAETANVTVNITSLTTLAMYTANGNQDLANMTANWATLTDQLTTEKLANAQAQVNQNFSGQLTTEGLNAATYDFFSSVFNADGTGIDAVMDSISVDIDMSANSVDVMIDGQTFTFDPNMDVSSINIGGSNIDLSGVTGGGDWTLMITGTTTTAGFTIDIPEKITVNSSAPGNLTEFEDKMNGQYPGSISITEVSSSSTKAVYKVAFSSTTEGVTISGNLLYTYTKN